MDTNDYNMVYNAFTLDGQERCSHITNARTHGSKVTQTNMIYLVGLPKSIAHEDLLASEPYCGQYGPITKVTIKETNGYRS